MHCRLESAFGYSHLPRSSCIPLQLLPGNVSEDGEEGKGKGRNSQDTCEGAFGNLKPF